MSKSERQGAGSRSCGSSPSESKRPIRCQKLTYRLDSFLRTLIHHSTVDLLPAIYLLSNHLAPSYVPLELGVGSSVLGPAVREVSGVSREAMKRLWDKWGDPGDVAFEAKGNVRTLIRPTPLVAYKVFEDLKKIARTKGTGAAKAKGDIVRKLLVQAKGEEVRYLVVRAKRSLKRTPLTDERICSQRTLVSHIRIGAVRLVSPRSRRVGA